MTARHRTPTLAARAPDRPPAHTDTVDGAQLLDEARNAILRYAVLPSGHATTAVVLWIVATHGVPAWNAAPRLVIRAPEKRCGKSRLLDLVEALAHRPLMTTNASPSAVYRSIGLSPKDPPTLLIDEADAIFGPAAKEHEDLRGLLNAGHQRGRPALRYDAGRRVVDRIETFAFVALAGIGSMPDTIEDRAVIIQMRRRAPDEHVQPYRARRDGPALTELGTRLHQWVRAHLDHLADATPDMPVEDRAADTWEPLIALADLAGGRWGANSREALLALLKDETEAAEVPLSVRLLMDCRTAFGAAPALPSVQLIARLKADLEAPWSDLAGTGLTVRRLGLMLRDYHITSSMRRWQDGTQSRGYSPDDFRDAWTRYCPTIEDQAGPRSTYAPDKRPNRTKRPVAGQSGTDIGSGTDANVPTTPSGVGHLADRASARTAVPRPTSVPRNRPPTCDGTLGTDGTGHPDRAHDPVCITCREPLTHDDGTHTHPTCTTA